jgi:hypothetical protein
LVIEGNLSSGWYSRDLFPTYANCGAVVEGNLSSGWYSRDINEFPAYANYGSVVYQSAAHLSHVNKSLRIVWLSE